METEASVCNGWHEWYEHLNEEDVGRREDCTAGSQNQAQLACGKLRRYAGVEAFFLDDL